MPQQGLTVHILLKRLRSALEREKKHGALIVSKNRVYGRLRAYTKLSRSSLRYYLTQPDKPKTKKVPVQKKKVPDKAVDVVDCNVLKPIVQDLLGKGEVVTVKKVQSLLTVNGGPQMSNSTVLRRLKRLGYRFTSKSKKKWTERKNTSKPGKVNQELDRTLKPSTVSRNIEPEVDVNGSAQESDDTASLDIIPCAVCKKCAVDGESEKWSGCNSCDRWYHDQCLSAHYKCSASFSTHFDSPWLCPSCYCLDIKERKGLNHCQGCDEEGLEETGQWIVCSQDGCSMAAHFSCIPITAQEQWHCLICNIQSDDNSSAMSLS